MNGFRNWACSETQPEKGRFDKSVNFHVTCLFDHASVSGLGARDLGHHAAV
ncbi:hypothetical protein [uncultured Tateyamaria sp.]|uniref:hypothetical protein n=1 Tax=uncultured Tateyamaria sp. TaxID=455651 RepID=UPI0026042D4C|nr:hypothetical protein [uncultured Tateyamaria sp.]